MTRKLWRSAAGMLAAAVLFSACGSSTDVSADSSTAMVEVSVESVAEEATPEPTPEITPEPTEEPTPEPTEEPTPTPEPTPTEEPIPEGMMYSRLTGELIDKEIGQRRPFSVMINNVEAAIPQSGISAADIIYEIEVEGSITRMMAVFQDPSGLQKIGPCRSARHYFLWFGDDLDVIYTHFGWSAVARHIIEDQGREDINGQDYDGDGRYYRTTDRVAPHNAYVTGDGLISIAAERGFRTNSDGHVMGFQFTRKDRNIDGEDAVNVYIPFAYDSPYFVYNADDGLYYRYEYGGAHIDVENGQQLAFKNVIVQFVDQWLMGDGYLLDMDVFSTGSGYYFTNGKVIPITWHKPNGEEPTRYYTQDGKLLSLNPGKTMFEVCNQDNQVTWDAAGTNYSYEYVEDDAFVADDGTDITELGDDQG